MDNTLVAYNREFYLLFITGIIKNDNDTYNFLNPVPVPIKAYFAPLKGCNLPNKLKGIIADKDGNPISIKINESVRACIRRAFDLDSPILVGLNSKSEVDAALCFAESIEQA